MQGVSQFCLLRFWLVVLTPVYLLSLLYLHPYFIKLGEARTCGTHTQGDTVYLWQASPWTCRLYLCKSAILPSCCWINCWPSRNVRTEPFGSLVMHENLPHFSRCWCRVWTQLMHGLVLWDLQQAFCNLQEGCPQEDLIWIVWSYFDTSSFQVEYPRLVKETPEGGSGG